LNPDTIQKQKQLEKEIEELEEENKILQE